ncbi:MAG: S8 family serine peptidase [Pseudobacteriovorax sp.]|nr:S8 family serine peptidase [Pseudobacteriovorax sp.]
MRRKSFPITPLLLGALAFSGCQGGSGKKSSPAPDSPQVPPPTEDNSAVSARPSEVDQFMTTVQLSIAPLLSPSSMVDGAISPEAIEAINAEHKLFKEKIAFISPEIEVVYEYKMVLNAFSLVVPGKYADRLDSVVESMSGTSFRPQQIARIEADEEESSLRNSWGDVTSVSFINANAVHEAYSIRGEGISVGIVDTGIDYTHAMFGGKGTLEAYTQNDPAILADDFPTAKVVGGYDFVGAAFNSGSPDWSAQIPSPDPDPIDESGHGTHVAGTVAGLGDGVNTYSGVAPAAELHALKVFGISGSTNDAVVIAALEYAADPNKDGDVSDRLDIVNLSLGGGYGSPNGLYDIAVKNLSYGGTVAVIAAGNSGDSAFIVGSPSTSAESISVAASVDAMDHNWKEAASVYNIGDEGDDVLVAVAEGSISAPIAGFTAPIKLVDMGLAVAPPSDQLKDMVKGNYALIQRGENPFCEKGQYAVDAGAVGFVVYSNNDDAPIVMGGDCSLPIPGVMISKAVGETIVAAMADVDVKFTLDSGQSFEYPERIDKIAGFSSRGPRSIDALLKPEVSAPGQAIVSAAVGTGNQGVRLSGTSMATPHIAGVAALLRQRYPNSTVSEIKSRMMNTAIPMTQEDGTLYPLSRQGVGRVDVMAAINSGLVFGTEKVSFGNTNIIEKKSLAFKIELQNMTAEPKIINLGSEVISDEWLIQIPKEVALAPMEKQTVFGSALVQPAFNAAQIAELDAYVVAYENGQVVNRIPVHTLRHRSSDLRVRDFVVEAASASEAAGAAGSVRIENMGAAAGRVYPFNLLAEDERQDPNTRVTEISFCDLESAGFRVVDSFANGVQSTYLEIAFKLYNPLTNWFFCEPTALIDINGDGTADYEVFGGQLGQYTTQLNVPDDQYSILVNAEKMQSIRAEYDATYNPASFLDYKDAVISVAPFTTYQFSTFATLAIDISSLPGDWRELAIKPGVLDNRLGASADDFASDYTKVYLDPFESTFYDFDPVMAVGPYDYETTRLTRGARSGKMIFYFPDNASTQAIGSKDKQSRAVFPTYQF